MSFSRSHPLRCGEATATSTLTFTSANPDTAQVVTVTGVDDDLVDGTETSTMTISIVDEASDNNLMLLLTRPFPYQQLMMMLRVHGF